MRNWLLVFGLGWLVGCEQNQFVGIGILDPPTGLWYQVEPSGTPGAPSGVVLRWDDPAGRGVDAWNIYGRQVEGGVWHLRGTTSSTSFHDRGQPELQYHVTAVGSGSAESDPSGVVTVDERLALDRPATLSSISLDAAVALVWSDDSYRSDPDGFWHYRVYGTSYDLDRNACGTTWSLEGTTVAPEFRAAALPNGVPRCFAVSGVVIEGFESLWSPIRADTPRPEARNVALTARQVADPTAGFRFWRDANGNGLPERGELGRVGAGSAADRDFVIERDQAGRLLIQPGRAGVTVAVYGSGPIGDLTDIDLAPSTGFSAAAAEARPGCHNRRLPFLALKVDPAIGRHRRGGEVAVQALRNCPGERIGDGDRKGARHPLVPPSAMSSME